MSKVLKAAFGISMESDAEVDNAIEELVEQQGGAASPDQVNEVLEDIDVLDDVQEGLAGDVSMEQLIHARGVVAGIASRYGVGGVSVSTESLGSDELTKEQLLADIEQYRSSMESFVVASMEGMFLSGSSLDNIGKNLEAMRRGITLLKSNDVDRIKTVKLNNARLFLKIAGDVPKDLSKAIGGVSKVLEETLRYGNESIDAAIRAGQIAAKTDWKDEAAADKARKEIAAIKLNTDKLRHDLNEAPVFGNRSFKVTVKGEPGSLGDWNRKFSFSGGIPNPGVRYSAAINGAAALAGWGVGKALVGAGILTAPYLTGLGIMIALRIRNSKAKIEISVKELAGALDTYSKVAENIYSKRTEPVRKDTVHKKLVSDLKGTDGIPKDVRKAIIGQSSFGWDMVNGVYDVVSHSVWALASIGKAASE